MAGGAKKGKKKWSKGKVREKALHMVLFDQQTYDKLVADVPKMKLITPSTIVERFKVNGSLARKAIRELVNLKLIKEVSYSSKQGIFTRATRDE
jgi:small subunit ribosomal protein S25e